jgi:hypothetical protein
MNLNQLRALLDEGESESLDWKKDWPPSLLGGKRDKGWDRGRGELLKDLVSLANSFGNHRAHLVYGVKDLGSRREVFGISKLFDDADFQQWAKNIFDPPPKFSYASIQWNSSINIGVFTIERTPNFPHVVKDNLGNILYEGQVWFRRGTQNNIALYDDLQEMFEGEKPIKIARLNDPEVSNVKDYYEKQGREVVAPLLAEIDKYLVQGYEIAAYPETRRKIWVGMLAQDRFEHVLLLKPKSKG